MRRKFSPWHVGFLGEERGGNAIYIIRPLDCHHTNSSRASSLVFLNQNTFRVYFLYNILHCSYLINTHNLFIKVYTRKQTNAELIIWLEIKCLLIKKSYRVFSISFKLWILISLSKWPKNKARPLRVINNCACSYLNQYFLACAA